MALDLKSIVTEAAKAAAVKLDKEIDDGFAQTIAAEVMEVLGDAFAAAGAELKALNNNNDGN